MFSRGSKPDRPGPSGRSPVPSIIGADLHVTGDLRSGGEIQIDGSVDGDVVSHKILVGESAMIRGELVADVIRIHGTVHGQIRAREVTLARTARMVGDIQHEELAIEQGAFLEGHCRHIETQKVEADPRPALSAPALDGDGELASSDREP